MRGHFVFFNLNLTCHFYQMYTAIIVEPRKHKALEFVLKNMLNCLSSQWEIVLFHGNTNVDYSNAIVNKLTRVRTVHLDVDNLTSDAYSELFTTNTIYANIPTEMYSKQIQ